MKKVILNGISLTGREIYGIQRYATELLYELDGIVSRGELAVVVPEKGERELHFNNIEVLRADVDTGSRRAVKLWNWFGFSRYVKKQGALSMDLTLGLPFNGLDITAVHDCTIEHCRENANTLTKKLTRLLYILRVFLNSRRAKAIITLTEYSRNDIASLYRIPKKRIAIVGCGWQHFERIVPDFGVLDRLGAQKDRYFFALGSRLWHKNYRWVAEAARQNPQYMFIVSGSSSLGTSDTSLDSKPDNIIYAGYLSDGEVKALMTCCRAFLQPSLYEGFGIPPMEAMSCGADCIVSDRTSLPEVYRDSVWYIDPLKYDGIDMDSIMSAPKKDSRCVLRRFSWRQSAERLYRIMSIVRSKSE